MFKFLFPDSIEEREVFGRHVDKVGAALGQCFCDNARGFSWGTGAWEAKDVRIGVRDNEFFILADGAGSEYAEPEPGHWVSVGC